MPVHRLLALFQSLGSVVFVARVPFVSAKVKVLENQYCFVLDLDS